MSHTLHVSISKKDDEPLSFDEQMMEVMQLHHKIEEELGFDVGFFIDHGMPVVEMSEEELKEVLAPGFLGSKTDLLVLPPDVPGDEQVELMNRIFGSLRGMEGISGEKTILDEEKGVLKETL